ncbi:MAG: polysaccharide biosynthesis tyrosine autokinase, partial [Kiritimatiellia bacterium]
LLVLVVGSVVTFSLPRQYEASSKIKIKEDLMDDAVFGRPVNMPYNPYFLQTEVEIIRSTRILNDVVDQCNLVEKYSRQYLEEGQRLDKPRAVAILSNKIYIDVVRSTSAVQVSARSDTPEGAAEIANKIASVYFKYRLDVKTAEMNTGLDSLKEEWRKQQRKVEEKDANLQRVREEVGPVVLSIGRDTNLSTTTIMELEGQRIANRADMIGRKARFDALESLSPEDRISAVSMIAFDRNVDDIKKQLMDSEVSLRLMQESLGPNHPDVKRMVAGVEELKAKLTTAINGMIIGLRSDYETSKAKYDTLAQELSIIKAEETSETRAKARILEKAERELMIEQNILDALQAKIAQEQITVQTPRSPVEIFEPAEIPLRFVFPKIPLFLALSAVLGVMAGVGMAFFIEYLDTSVKTVDDLERYLGLSVIGVIPQKVKPLIQEGPDSPHAEAYRVLRTNLLFANKGVGGGAYAVVSGGVGEGKSTTLFNLAFICASMGDKVLIVDSDLRRPVQHTILGMSNRFGLTNVLMRDVPIEETIKSTSVPNLHFLPSGRLPRNAVGLLDAQRVRDLIKNLKTRYDYVFFDSPPIMGVSDSSIIASEVDGVLLVVQYRKYPRQMSARAKRLIENVGGNIIGVVLNNINILKDDYYYYHSYYSHYSQTDNTEPPEAPRTEKS